MERINKGLQDFLSALPTRDDQQRKAQRAAEVIMKWKTAIEKVYKKNAPLILSHINGVYILQEEGRKHLIVFADDSMVRADIDAMQEFLKISFKEQGECIEEFSVHASRNEMKNRHIYSQEKTRVVSELQRQETLQKVRAVELSQEEMQAIERTVEDIEENTLRNAIKEAMIAHRKSKHIKM